MVWGRRYQRGKKLRIDEAIVAAELDWEVDRRRLIHGGPIYLLNIPEQYAVCRQKDNAVLGVVGPDYAPLQNKEAFDGSNLSSIPAKPPLRQPAA